MEHFYQTLGQDWFTYPNLYRSMVEKFNNGSHFVEVGTWKGRSASYMAVEIINSDKQIKFDCIDNWIGSHECFDDQNSSFDPIVLVKDGLYNEYLNNIEPVKHIINSVRMNSMDASKLYEDESLDFVFIDAEHDYENVKLDIEHWLPKVKPGGVLAGHDYNHGEVKQAVDEKFGESNIIDSEQCWIYNK